MRLGLRDLNIKLSYLNQMSFMLRVVKNSAVEYKRDVIY